MKLSLLVVLIFLSSVTEAQDKEEDESLGIDIEDYILQEILLEDDVTVNDLTGELDRYLQGLMRHFRNKVLKLYRRVTCSKNELCDPFHFFPLLPASSLVDEFSFQQNLLEFQLKAFRQLDQCLMRPLSSYSLVHRSPHTSFLALATSNRIQLVSIEGDCKIQGYSETLESTSICMHTVAIEDQLEMLVVWDCHSANNLIRIYMMTNTSVERFQLLETEKIDHVFDFALAGVRYLCFVTSQQCRLYLWTGVNFEIAPQRNLSLRGFGRDVIQLSHNFNHYLISIGRLTREQASAFGVWKIQLNKDAVALELYQVLNDCVVSDLHIFQLGGLQFIATACEDVPASYLYWWSGSQFLIWQLIAVDVKTLSWTSLKHENGETVLIALQAKGNEKWLRAYTLENGHYKFSEVDIQVLDSTTSIKTARLQHSHILLAFASESVQKYKLEVIEIADTTKLKDEDQYIYRFQQMLDQQEAMIESLKEDLANYTSLMNEETSISDEFECEILVNQVDEMERRSKAIEDELRSWKNVNIYRELRVNELVVKKSLAANHVAVADGIINDVVLTELEESVLTKTTEQTFDVPVVFEGGLFVQRLETVSTVNGINYDNLLTTDANITFTRPQIFQSLAVDTVRVEGLVNDVSVSDWVLKRSRFPTIIHGRKNIKKLKAAGNMRLNGGKINRVDIQKLFSFLWSRNEERNLETELEVQGDISINGQLYANVINGVNIKNFAGSIVSSAAEQQINVLKVKDFSVGKLIVRGSVNGVKLERELLTVKSEQEIVHPVIINGFVAVKNDLDVLSEVVNGISNWPTSLVTRCGDQTITGRKVFLNGFEAEKIRSDSFEHFLQHFGDITVDELITVSLNDIKNVTFVFSNSIMRSSRDLTLHGQLKCSRLLFQGTVNDGNMIQHRYMTTNTQQNISTPLILLGEEVTVDGEVRMESFADINGISLHNVKRNCLLKSGDQEVGRLTVEDMTCLQDIQLLEHDNLLHLLLQNVDWRLSNMELWRDVHLEKDLDTEYLNGIHLDSFLSKIYSVNDDLHLNAKTFNRLIVLGDVFTSNSRLNDVNFDDFYNSIVRLSTNQHIKGDLRVTKPVLSLNDSVRANVVNSFDLKKRLEQLVQVDKFGVIQQRVNFMKGFEVLGDINAGWINANDVSYTLNNILLQSPQEFINPIRFLGKLTTRELEVDGTVNGAYSSDWLRLNDSRTYDGNVLFKAKTAFNNLLVDSAFVATESAVNKFNKIEAEHVELSGHLNGVKLERFISRILSKSRDQVINNSAIVFYDDVIVDNLATKNRPVINAVSLDEILNRGMATHTAQVINGGVQFSTLSSVDFKNRIEASDVQWSDGLPEFDLDVYKTNDGKRGWSHLGNIIFDEDVSVKENSRRKLTSLVTKLKCNVGALVVNSVNGISLKHFIDNRVTLSTNQTILSDSRYKGCRNNNLVIEEDVEFRCPVAVEGNFKANNVTLRL